MASTEDIEARLCAYVDGELDEAARGEIERHLTANPQHAKLIGELSHQRDMLRALPRERAPADISEHLQASLERAVLLGDDPAEDTHILRIDRWSQVRAAAAVLLLVFGLAAVVYYVVPRPGGNDTIAIVSGPGSSGAADLATTSPHTGSSLVSEGQPDPDHRPASPEVARVLSELRGGVDAVDATISRTAPAARDAAAEVLVAVDASDPFAAQSRVRDYLVSNRIQFEAIEADMPEALALKDTQLGMGSRLQNLTRSKMRADEPARSGTQLASPDDANQPSTITPGVGPPLAKIQVAEVPPAAPVDKESDGPATAPSDQIVKQEPGVEKKQLAPTQQIYRARMNRQEIDLMCSNMSDPSAGQLAQVIPASKEQLGELNLNVPSLDSATLPSGLADERDGERMSMIFEGAPTTTPSDTMTPDGWLPFGITPPATGPSDGQTHVKFGAGAGVSSRTPAGDERIDVMIVVRGGIESHDAAHPNADLPDQAHTGESPEPVVTVPSTHPVDELLTPTTSPATQPSSP